MNPDMSMHKRGGWLGQYERMLRWHERLVTAFNAGSPDIEDFSYAFFQNCYHLRDWMRHSGGASPQDLDALFSGSLELQLCRDLCNGTKHLKLTSASVDAMFSTAREYSPPAPTGWRPIVLADTTKHDLLGLASKCVDAWRTFIGRA